MSHLPPWVDPDTHDPADCPFCTERMHREPARMSGPDADRAAEDYFERLADVADRRFR